MSANPQAEDERKAAIEAVLAKAEAGNPEVSDAVPAADPEVAAGDPQPQSIGVTPPGLFIANFYEIYGAFKAVAGNTTVKPEQSRFLIAEAAKYAHAMLAVQFGLIGRQ